MALAFAVMLLAAAPEISGDWITADGTAIVRIADCGGAVCGRVARVLARGPNVPTTDIHNPVRALRSRPLVGLPVLNGFVSSGGRYVNGRAYDPKTGRSYRASLRVEPNGSLRVTGCVAIICRSQHWRRAR